MDSKHYKRMNGFLKYDIEGREISEQKEILLQAIKVSQELLKELE